MKKLLALLLLLPALAWGQTYPSPTFSSITIKPTYVGPYTYLMSASYLAGPLPTQFQIYAPLGPIPAASQPYRVNPLYDANGNPYFYLSVTSTGPYGSWTNAQIAASSVAALSSTGFLISTLAVALP